MRGVIISLVVQILQQANVTHSAALTTFLELTGNYLLVSRLHQEVLRTNVICQFKSHCSGASEGCSNNHNNKECADDCSA